MSDDATETDVERKPDAKKRRRKPRKLQLLSDLDRRTAAYRRARDLISAIESDLGGADRLSTGERQLVQRAGVTAAVIEDVEATWLAGGPIDPAAYCTLVNSQRRLFETVGLRRVPREVNAGFDAYVAGARERTSGHASPGGAP